MQTLHIEKNAKNKILYVVRSCYFYRKFPIQVYCLNPVLVYYVRYNNNYHLLSHYYFVVKSYLQIL